MQRCWRYVEFWRLRRRASSHLIHRKMRERIRGLLKTRKSFEEQQRPDDDKYLSRTTKNCQQWNSLKKNPLVAVQKTILPYECKKMIKKSPPLMWDWMFYFIFEFNTGHIMQLSFYVTLSSWAHERTLLARVACWPARPRQRAQLTNLCIMIYCDFWVHLWFALLTETLCSYKRKGGFLI